MMVSEKERTRIRRFVCGQLQEEPDLNTLTLGILKRRYLAYVQCESLSPVAKAFMKQVVEEELIKMQEEHDQDGSDLKTNRTQNKRKRQKENDEVISEAEDESTAKKSRCQSSSSSSESEDIEDSKTGSKEDEQIKSGAQTKEKQMTKSQQKKKGNRIKSDDSSDEKVNDSEVEREENNCSSSEEEVKKENTTGKGVQNKRKSPGQKLPQSDEDNDTDNKSKSSNKVNSSDSSDDNAKEENLMVEKQNNNSDSDSSSLPSLEDESGSVTKKPQEKETSTKKKTVKKKESTEGQRDDNKAIVRLKRYITLCGVRRNYKKLFEGCKSIRAKVAALKKELEDLGVHGQPTIEKCKKVRMKREEDEELADLDVSNIIATHGRPRRRGTQQEHHDPPSMTYQRALNSCSDSDEESTTQRGPRRTTHWANLQGIISDDADSN